MVNGEIAQQDEDLAGDPVPVASEAEIQPPPTLSDQEIAQLSRSAREFIETHPPIVTKMEWLGPEFSVQSPYRPTTLEEGRRSIPAEVGRRFDAHGIAKGSETQQLASLNRLLSSGVEDSEPFHTMELFSEDEAAASVMGAAGPFEDGGFIVIGFPDQLIREGGIAGVLVNEHFGAAIPTLQARFPSIKFIKGSELPDRLMIDFGLEN